MSPVVNSTTLYPWSNVEENSNVQAGGLPPNEEQRDSGVIAAVYIEEDTEILEKSGRAARRKVWHLSSLPASHT